MSASILVHSSSCTWTFAQRFHSSASRSSWMRGVSDVRTACRRTIRSSRSCLVGQRAHRPDGQLHVLQQLIGLLEREAFGRRRASRTSGPAPAAAAGSSACCWPLASRCTCSCALELLRGGVVTRLAARRRSRRRGRSPATACAARTTGCECRRRTGSPTSASISGTSVGRRSADCFASWRRSKRFSAARHASAKRRSSSAAHAAAWRHAFPRRAGLGDADRRCRRRRGLRRWRTRQCGRPVPARARGAGARRRRARLRRRPGARGPRSDALSKSASMLS